MDLDEALARLGLDRSTDADRARAAYRRVVRTEHPDLVGGDGGDVADRTTRTARVNEAWAIVAAALAEGPLDRHGPTTPSERPGPEPSGPAADGTSPGGDGADHGDGLDGALWLPVPADEAYLVLYEAGGRVGHIAYVDRHLGLLEVVVRFEGGPTCSVLITLQGRAEGTEAMCTMTSIEAAPTPPIAAVLEALADEVVGLLDPTG